MAYWLVKTEPKTYSIEDLARDGSTRWDGVRNFQARSHLRAMHRGDQVLIYHSQSNKAVVGVAKVKRAAYPDPTAKGKDFSAVDLEYQDTFGRAVTLADMRGETALKAMPLFKQSRLSVMPVKASEFKTIVALSREVTN